MNKLRRKERSVEQAIQEAFKDIPDGPIDDIKVFAPMSVEDNNTVMVKIFKDGMVYDFLGEIVWTRGTERGTLKGRK